MFFNKTKDSLLSSANSKFSIGDFQGAIKLYKEYIKKCTGEKDQNYLGALQNLGVCHKKLADFDIALIYYEQALDLSRKIKSAVEEASASSNIAIIYKNQGSELIKSGKLKEAKEKFTKSEELFNQAIELDLEMDNIEGVASSLLNLGNLYKNDFKNSQAMSVFKKSIEYSKKIDNDLILGSALCGIGNVHLQVEEYDMAIEKYQEALLILQSTSNYDTRWLINLTQANLQKAIQQKNSK